jgi:hypothetical protein
LTAAEHQRREVEFAGVGAREPGNQFVTAGAVREHPLFHCRDELAPILVEEALTV